MGTLEIILGIALLIMAVFLVIAVLMQSGSSKRLSGSIAGGAETFFGKNKGKTIDKMLGKITNIVAIVFVLVVLATFYITSIEEEASSEAGNSSSAGVTSVAPSTSGSASSETSDVDKSEAESEAPSSEAASSEAATEESSTEAVTEESSIEAGAEASDESSEAAE